MLDEVSLPIAFGWGAATDLSTGFCNCTKKRKVSEVLLGRAEATMQFSNFFPDAEALVALEPEELAVSFSNIRISSTLTMRST